MPAACPLALAGVEQAIHTPPFALATMLHRSVALVHGADDVWADPDESVLLAEALAEGATESRDGWCSEPATIWRRRADAVVDEMAADLAARIRSVELPPVLLAIEGMTDGVR